MNSDFNNIGSHSSFPFQFHHGPNSTTNDRDLDISASRASSSSSRSYFIQDQNEWFVEGSDLWPILLLGYSFVFLVGVIGNTLLLFALYGSGGSRRARSLPVRNHLMVNLAAADLFVTAVCVPISACAAASHACWPNFVVSWMCQLSPLLQKTPVAASTLSLALLSLDRWAAFRHPRFAQRFRERRFVIMSMISIWILASLVSAPTFWARQWENRIGTAVVFSTTMSPAGSGEEMEADIWTTSFSTTTSFYQILTNSSSNGGAGANLNGSIPNSSSSSWSGICLEKWTNLGLEIAYVATYLGTAFISPALIVAACHASVSQKLTSQLKPGKSTAGGAGTATRNDTFHGGAGIGGGGGIGLLAGAVRQKPKQVIIVAHDPNNRIINQDDQSTLQPQPNLGQRSKIIQCNQDSDDDDDEYLQMQIQADLESFRQISEQIKLNSSAAAKKVATGNLAGVGGKRKSSTSKILFKTLHPNSHLLGAGQGQLTPSSNNSRTVQSSRNSRSSIHEEDEEHADRDLEFIEGELPSQGLAFIDSFSQAVGAPAAETYAGGLRRGSSSTAAAVTSSAGRRQSLNQFIFGRNKVELNQLRRKSSAGLGERATGVDSPLNNNSLLKSFNTTTPIITIQAAKNESAIIRSHRRFRKKLLHNEKRQQMMVTMTMGLSGSPPPQMTNNNSSAFLPTYSSQSFRSRRRAANLMAALAVVFVLCWVPYVICTIWDMCTGDKYLVRLLIPFALFLGHAHSAINPVVSWRLNRSAFVRFQKKSFFASLVPHWSWLRICRLSCRSMASCRYYCCSWTGNCCCVKNYEVNSSSVAESHNYGIGVGGGGGRAAAYAYPQQYRWGPGTYNYGRTTAGARGRPSLAAAISNRHKRPTTFTARLGYHLCCQWCTCCRKKRRPNPYYASAGGMAGAVGRYQHGGGGYGRRYHKRHRRGSSPDDGGDDDGWNPNTSTNEAALGAFHPKYLSRLPAPDPISRCHTSHFLQ